MKLQSWQCQKWRLLLRKTYPSRILPTLHQDWSTLGMRYGQQGDVTSIFINVGHNGITLLWRHNGHDCVPNHQPHRCSHNCLFGRRSKKTSKLRVTGLCVGNSPGTGEFPHKWPVMRKMLPFDDVIMTNRELDMFAFRKIQLEILVFSDFVVCEMAGQCRGSAMELISTLLTTFLTNTQLSMFVGTTTPSPVTCFEKALLKSFCTSITRSYDRLAKGVDCGDSWFLLIIGM